MLDRDPSWIFNMLDTLSKATAKIGYLGIAEELQDIQFVLLSEVTQANSYRDELELCSLNKVPTPPNSQDNVVVLFDEN